ncbi:CRISPR-associated endonuclease Cas2 [Lihuaxuella thermophila]|uniref:CRISPR-associated endoribonuclease Cas2 n=1 Tax=Lihuaxuella thermophila TaxID=1173111 RepID=A0A1H8E6Y0_9BACL|nr:CRISPR-associated endonuclease Cas2 [Lihuaxuella thermophila]SEN14874.1 CRISPR-associated protein Cas2 [Lihuaxuella thermophila]
MKRVVSYDIVDDRRRNKVFKLLKDYGQWIQYSVFEVDCDEKDWLMLEFRLAALLGKEDSLCVYTLCRSCSRKVSYKGELRYRLQEQQNNIL